MRDLAVLVPPVVAIVARLAGPGGALARAVVAESVLVKQQLLILSIAPGAVPPTSASLSG